MTWLHRGHEGWLAGADSRARDLSLARITSHGLCDPAGTLASAGFVPHL